MNIEPLNRKAIGGSLFNFFRAFVRVKDYLDIISASSDVIVFRQLLMDFYSRNHVSNLQSHSSNTLYTKSHLNSFKQQL